jgi:hypothetical protein
LADNSIVDLSSGAEGLNDFNGNRRQRVCVPISPERSLPNRKDPHFSGGIVGWIIGERLIPAGFEERQQDLRLIFCAGFGLAMSLRRLAMWVFGQNLGWGK